MFSISPCAFVFNIQTNLYRQTVEICLNIEISAFFDSVISFLSAEFSSLKKKHV